jgi:hypothetical protein
MFILISRPSVVAAVLVERGLASTNPVLRPVLAYDQRAAAPIVESTNGRP